MGSGLSEGQGSAKRSYSLCKARPKRERGQELTQGLWNTFGGNFFFLVLKTSEASAASVQERENRKEREAEAG